MKEFIQLKDVDEVSIGQAVIARSIFVGVEQAVKEMIDLVKRA
jgi:pyridoxine 5-phosphate synthase